MKTGLKKQERVNSNESKKTYQERLEISPIQGKTTFTGTEASPFQEEKSKYFLSFGKIMPKKMNQDKERLYEENIKLKEELRYLESQNIKLKTRVNIAEKEKQKMISRYNCSDFSSTMKENYMSKYSSKNSINPKTYQKNKDVATKIIRQTKDEIENLKLQNQRIKKSIKYTQILEVQIENKRLIDETRRLEEYVNELLYNESYDMYENQIRDLKRLLQEDKKRINAINFQFKAKEEECEELKEKIKLIQVKKIEKERKLQKDMMKSEKDNCRKASKIKVKTEKQEIRESIQNLQLETRDLKEEVQHKNIIVHRLTNLFEEKQKECNNLREQLTKQIDEKAILREELYKAQKKINGLEKSQQCSPKKQEKPQKNEENEEKYEDDFNEEQEKYEEQFELLELKEQQIKIDKKNRKKEKNIFEGILKETITYKMKSQRYTYENFKSDISESGISHFTIEQLVTLLTNEPFFLSDEELQYLLKYCFGKQEIEVDDSITSKVFLKKMKHFIGEINLLPEQEEQKKLINIAEKIIKNEQKLASKGSKILKKDSFIKIMKETGEMSTEEIQLCLGEACLVSTNIQKINYENFLKRFKDNEN